MMLDRLRGFTLTLFAVGASACSFTADAASDDPPSCPIYETRAWAASVEATDTGAKPFTLQVRGTVDLPNPSYEITFRPGPMDRRQPPGLTILLDAKAAEGVALQVIDQRQVEFGLETHVSDFHTVRVVCGERVLSEFSNVSVAD